MVEEVQVVPDVPRVLLEVEQPHMDKAEMAVPVAAGQVAVVVPVTLVVVAVVAAMTVAVVAVAVARRSQRQRFRTHSVSLPVRTLAPPELQHRSTDLLRAITMVRQLVAVHVRSFGKLLRSTKLLVIIRIGHWCRTRGCV